MIKDLLLCIHVDQCTSGFSSISGESDGSPGNRKQVITRLFPSMKFGCNGTIVRLTAAVVDRVRGSRSPLVQIWRENATQSGVYYRPHPGHDIPLREDSNVCLRHRLDGGMFRCTLNETFRIHVQPGDILGLELPSTHDDDFDVKFLEQGDETNISAVSYIFEGQLNSTVNIHEAVRNTTNLPLITFLVILGVLLLPIYTFILSEHSYYT